MAGKVSSQQSGRSKKPELPEEAVKLLKEHYEAIFEQASDAIVLWRPDMKITAVNRRAEELSGLRREQLIGQSILEVLEEESVKTAVQNFRIMQKNGRAVPPHILRIKCVNGTRTGEVTTSPIKSGGKIVAFQTLIRDVSDKIEEQRILQESEEKLRVTFNSIIDGLIITDMNGKIIDANDTALKIYGMKKKAELLGKMPAELLVEEDREQARKGMERVITKGFHTQVEYKSIKKDGSIFPVEVSAGLLHDSDDKPTGFITVVKDIAKRKQAEEKLRKNEEKLRLMFESVAEGIVITDLEGNIVELNNKALKMGGYKSAKEVMGESGFKFLAPEEYERAQENLANTIKTGAGMALEYKALRKDGSEYPLELSVTVMKDKDEKPTGIICIMRDITERKEADRKIRESEERFRSIFDNALDGIVLADLETKAFFTANRSFCEMLGYELEEIKKLHVKDIHPREDLDHVLSQFERQVKKEITLAEDIPVLKKDGGVLYADVNSTPITVEGKMYLMGLFRDVSVRKYMEEQFMRSQRLESLGMFAAGLAHDFKDYCSKIFGHASFMKNSLDMKSTLYSRASDLLDTAQDVSGLVDQLKAFSGKSTFHPTVMSVEAPVNETLRLLRRQMRPNIKIEARFKAIPGLIKADYWHIQKAILNILINASEAMPTGGILSVTTSNRNIDKQFAKAYPWVKPGRYVVIEIKDTGMGMTKKILDAIFDPFFTTKGKGKGAGLGLSIAYGTVKDHGGTIQVSSKVGEGTTTEIYLPAEKS